MKEKVKKERPRLAPNVRAEEEVDRTCPQPREPPSTSVCCQFASP
jgi:hypothetical protein